MNWTDNQEYGVVLTEEIYNELKKLNDKYLPKKYNCYVICRKKRGGKINILFAEKIIEAKRMGEDENYFDIPDTKYNASVVSPKDLKEQIGKLDNDNCLIILHVHSTDTTNLRSLTKSRTGRKRLERDFKKMGEIIEDNNESDEKVHLGVLGSLKQIYKLPYDKIELNILIVKPQGKIYSIIEVGKNPTDLRKKLTSET